MLQHRRAPAPTRWCTSTLPAYAWRVNRMRTVVRGRLRSMTVSSPPFKRHDLARDGEQRPARPRQADHCSTHEFGSRQWPVRIAEHRGRAAHRRLRRSPLWPGRQAGVGSPVFATIRSSSVCWPVWRIPTVRRGAYPARHERRSARGRVDLPVVNCPWLPHAGHLHVEHEAVEARLLQIGAKCFGAGIGDRLHPRRTQRARERSAQALVVVDAHVHIARVACHAVQRNERGVFGLVPFGEGIDGPAHFDADLQSFADGS